MGRKTLSINKDVVTEIRKECELGKNYYRNSPNTPRPGRQATQLAQLTCSSAMQMTQTKGKTPKMCVITQEEEKGEKDVEEAAAEQAKQ